MLRAAMECAGWWCEPVEAEYEGGVPVSFELSQADADHINSEQRESMRDIYRALISAAPGQDKPPCQWVAVSERLPPDDGGRTKYLVAWTEEGLREYAEEMDDEAEPVDIANSAFINHRAKKGWLSHWSPLTPPSQDKPPGPPPKASEQSAVAVGDVPPGYWDALQKWMRGEAPNGMVLVPNDAVAVAVKEALERAVAVCKENANDWRERGREAGDADYQRFANVCDGCAFAIRALIPAEVPPTQEHTDD